MLVIDCLFNGCRWSWALLHSIAPMPKNSPDIRVRFGIRVRQLRTERGWSQEELADRAELHRTYIGAIERGEQNISLLNIEKLAATFDIPLAELFATFTDKPTPST